MSLDVTWLEGPGLCTTCAHRRNGSLGCAGNHPTAWRTARANACVNALTYRSEPAAEPLKAMHTDLKTDLDRHVSCSPTPENSF